jgi:hypothetical protein
MINVKKVLAYIYVLYAVTTIFTPKIKIGFELAGVYLFEVVCTALSFYLLLSNKLRFSFIEKSYFLYVFLCLFSWILLGLRSDSFDIESLLIIIKYSSFILLIPVAFYLKTYLTETILKKILYSQVLFVVLASAYTLYHTFFYPIDLSILINEYSPEYRLVGFVGYALTPHGLQYIGTGSVQMGVYIAFLFLIFLSLYLRIKKSRYLIMSFVLFAGLLLTYSRSGFMVMVIGIIYLISLRFLNKRVFKFTVVLTTTILLLILLTNFWGFISSWGIMAKLSERGFEDITRLRFWELGLNYILNNPAHLFFGTGYGSVYSVFGFGTLESLLFDTLVETGVFGLLFFLLTFYHIWKYSKKYSFPFQSNSYFKAILYGCYIALPGWLFANTVGGNSFQSDFMAPTLFLTLGICLSHTTTIDINKKINLRI